MQWRKGSRCPPIPWQIQILSLQMGRTKTIKQLNWRKDSYVGLLFLSLHWASLHGIFLALDHIWSSLISCEIIAPVNPLQSALTASGSPDSELGAFPSPASWGPCIGNPVDWTSDLLTTTLSTLPPDYGLSWMSCLRQKRKYSMHLWKGHLTFGSRISMLPDLSVVSPVWSKEHLPCHNPRLPTQLQLPRACGVHCYCGHFQTREPLPECGEQLLAMRVQDVWWKSILELCTGGLVAKLGFLKKFRVECAVACY